MCTHSLDKDLTDDPAESSFAKAMEVSVGTLSVLDKGGEVFKRIWCGLAFVRRPFADSAHLMVVCRCTRMQVLLRSLGERESPTGRHFRKEAV
jgi:hypothetical protein